MGNITRADANMKQKTFININALQTANAWTVLFSSL